MKNKIIGSSLSTAACLLVWSIARFIHFKNVKIPDFLEGFSLGAGSVAVLALICYLIIALKRKNSSTTLG